MDDQEKFVCEDCGKGDFGTPAQLEAHKKYYSSRGQSCNPKTQEQVKRKERIPFGKQQQRFRTPEKDGFVYRVFNDNWRKDPERIKNALAAGYEFINGEQSGKTAGTNEDGSVIKGILMRIPKEFYEEDQAAKQKEIDKVDQQINRGKFTEKAGDNRYSPGGGIKIETKLTP